jgi:ribosomal protein S6
METSDKDKKTYELAVLVKTEGELSGVVTIVGQHGAEILGELNPKRVALAYPIKKQKEGVFAYGTIRAYPDDAKKLEEDLRTRQDILRFMILALRGNAMAQQPGTAMAPRRRPMVAAARPSAVVESKPAPGPLSNEALEKKIEEILQ